MTEPTFVIDPREHDESNEPAVVGERTGEGVVQVSFANVEVGPGGSLGWEQYDGLTGALASWRWVDYQHLRTQRIRPADEPEDVVKQRIHPDDWNLLPDDVREAIPSPDHELDEPPEVLEL